MGMALTSRRPLLRRPLVRVALVAAVVVLVVGMFVFEPWKLFVDQTVDEAIPVAPVAAAPPAVAPAPAAAPAPQARTLAGTFISHEHASSGTVRILQLADGSRVLRLENLRTSNGPRLKVWLSDAPVVEGAAGWYLFDDGRHVDLGDLKGNVGSSNYPIPADVDLGGLTSVSIWCDRFGVSFAAAELR
jgi:Electron transfer DM13